MIWLCIIFALLLTMYVRLLRKDVMEYKEIVSNFSIKPKNEKEEKMVFLRKTPED